MRTFSSSEFANPGSIYKEGVNARKALIQGRKIAADFIGALSDEVYFTSGGTEANNVAIFGTLAAFKKKNPDKKPHLIISAIEHSSIMECAVQLESANCEVTRLAVDREGLVSLDELKHAIKPNTFLVSVMSVNNELGTIEPVREAAKVIRNARANGSPDLLFHTDASQAALYLDVNVARLGVDLLTLDSSKMCGPRGTGALYIKRGLQIEPIIFGGGQEKGLRSGTENLPAIMGFATALELASECKEKESANMARLRDIFIKGLLELSSNIRVNGGNQAPHIVNVCIPGIDNEFFVLQLDARGIACSTKTSCLRDEDESYVLKAIGAESNTSVRFSFGRWTKKRDIKRALKAMRDIMAKRR